MVLGHIEATPHGPPLAVLVRLGPLLPLALVLSWAALVRARRCDRGGSLAAGAALALGTAGAIHLALAPEHAKEGLGPGSLFVAAGLAQLALAGLVATRRGGRAALVALLAVSAGLLSLYAASRGLSLPGLDREAVDAVGLVTKLLEVAGTALGAAALTGRPRRLPLDGPTCLAALTLGAALVARPVFGLGPGLSQVAAALVGALATSALLGPASPAQARRAVADAAALSLLVRAGGMAPFLLAGAGGALARSAARRLPIPVVAPLAVAGLGVLALPEVGGRLEILHVSHPGEPWAALVAVVLAAGLTLAARTGGGLPPAAAFLGTHLGLQALRVLAGRTSLEAVEVPAASLGLFLVAMVVVADPDVTAGRGTRGVAAGALAGALDVILRDRGVPYPSLLGVALGVAMVGILWPLAARARRPLASPGGDGRRRHRPGAEPGVSPENLVVNRSYSGLADPVLKLGAAGRPPPGDEGAITNIGGLGSDHETTALKVGSVESGQRGGARRKRGGKDAGVDDDGAAHSFNAAMKASNSSSVRSSIARSLIERSGFTPRSSSSSVVFRQTIEASNGSS